MAKMVIRENEKEVEEKLKFFLEQDECGVVLKCINNIGRIWNILVIDDDGKCYLTNSISNDIGLQADEDGCIVIEHE